MKNLPIGEILKEYGYITEEQLKQALQLQKQQNPSKRLGAILVENGFLTETQMLEALAQRLHLELISLKNYPVSMDAVSRIPEQLALKYNLIAVRENNGTLEVAVNDPLDFYAIEDIRQVTNKPLQILLTDAKSIKNAIGYYYAEINAKRAVSQISSTAPQKTTVPAEIGFAGDNDVPVVNLLNSMLVRGFKTNASDIHIEIFEHQTVIRMRIDGAILDYATMAATLHPSLIARIKILANLDIAEKRIPQDGHFKVTIDGFEMNLRVSLIPTVYGEKAVLRFLYANTKIDYVGQFGMNESHYAKMLGLLSNPHGILYLTGPTGSGKTTTLYMAMEYLLQKPLNISTIEDPVERNIPRLNQMQVNNMAGLTFETGLRALLRQDPDVIMVGETRDTETADISIRAAITGHLVLSTMHTNDSISAVVRLADMGIAPYLIASALAGVVAQRLVRKICPGCRYETVPNEVEQAVLGNANITKVYKGHGCRLCNGTGYSGRVAVHEIAIIDKNLRKMIAQNAPVDAMYDYAIVEQGMKTLRDGVLELVRTGITSVEELLKVTCYE